jgi:hypothetical protein
MATNNNDDDFDCDDFEFSSELNSNGASFKYKRQAAMASRRKKRSEPYDNHRQQQYGLISRADIDDFGVGATADLRFYSTL